MKMEGAVFLKFQSQMCLEQQFHLKHLTQYICNNALANKTTIRYYVYNCELNFLRVNIQ